MPTEINKNKILYELMTVKMALNDKQAGFQHRRLSPTTRDVLAILIAVLDTCAEGVRSGKAAVFEVVTWQQTPLQGFELGYTEADET